MKHDQDDYRPNERIAAERGSGDIASEELIRLERESEAQHRADMEALPLPENPIGSGLRSGLLISAALAILIATPIIAGLYSLYSGVGPYRPDTPADVQRGLDSIKARPHKKDIDDQPAEQQPAEAKSPAQPKAEKE